MWSVNSHIDITWGLFRNANSQAPPRPTNLKLWGLGAQPSVF